MYAAMGQTIPGERFQQNACLHRSADAVIAFTAQRVEPFALLIAELPHIYLFAGCFAVTTYLRQSGAIDSGIDRNIKDVGVLAHDPRTYRGLSDAQPVDTVTVLAREWRHVQRRWYR
jgi:hypothetical protein